MIFVDGAIALIEPPTGSVTLHKFFIAAKRGRGNFMRKVRL